MDFLAAHKSSEDNVLPDIDVGNFGFLGCIQSSEEQKNDEEQATAYVRQAIAAVQAGNTQAANKYANSALGTNGADFQSRSLAATILMVETDEDIQALQNMKVYEDMVAYMAD